MHEAGMSPRVTVPGRPPCAAIRTASACRPLPVRNSLAGGVERVNPGALDDGFETIGAVRAGGSAAQMRFCAL